MKLIALVALIGAASATTYFKETFDNTYTSRWVQSDWKKSDGTRGDWELTAGEWYADKEADKGIMTTPDARFYATSAKTPSSFSNTGGKTLVLQFQVRHTQKIDCGGAYIKLLPANTDQKTFSGDSAYDIMFGPDICGTSTKRVHVIFNYKGENRLIKKTIPCESDQLSHVYTLIVNPDQTYEVRIDNKKKESGSLTDDWDFLPPKKIKDPALSKPADWVDDAKIDDPEDTKPAGYDDIPKQIADPEAKKPEDWDDEADGDWEPPMLDNPEYKGEWKARRIDNPEYKGVWVHPEIDNPEYKPDASIGQYTNIGAVGFELWQVKAGSIFDNIIVTDTVAEAESFFEDTFGKTSEAEKKMFDDIEAKKREDEEAERKKADEDRKTQESADEDEDEDEAKKDEHKHEDL
jgi:calreticulin